MKKANMRIFLLILIAATLQAESMDELLDTFAHNSDLSEKTRLENGGNVIVYTREMLESMQARTLKDVVKSLPTINYNENRYVIADPGYRSGSLAFNSNAIRVYIDDQEISSVTVGSGFFLVGSIDIGFVDHIEVYGLNPSYVYTTEPARILIRLYSKDPSRDRGGRVEASVGTRGYNQQVGQYAQSHDDLAYFVYLSRLDDRRETVQSLGSTLFRDEQRYHLFSRLQSGMHHFYLQAFTMDKDHFIGVSPDATPETAYSDSTYLHVGYEMTPLAGLKVGAVYETGSAYSHFEDTIKSEIKTAETMVTFNLQYIWDDLIIGAKYRHKHFYFERYQVAGRERPDPAFNFQKIASLYLEEHLPLGERWMVTLGGQLSRIDNNGGIEDRQIWLGRLGLIYSDRRWVFKTFLNRSAFIAEPYLYIVPVGTGGTVDPALLPEEVRNATQEIRYETAHHLLRGVLGISHDENVISLVDGKVINDPAEYTDLFGFLVHEYRHDTYNALMTQLSYRKVHNEDSAQTLEEYKAVMRLNNRLGRWIVFNEVIYYRDTENEKDYVDFSAGVKFRAEDRLNLSIKGENLFDRARANHYERSGIDTLYRPVTYDPLYVSPIDPRVYISAEYLF